MTVTETATAPSCVCRDETTEQLRDLLEAGYDQRAASHLLWGDPAKVPPPPPGADVALHARLFVRTAMSAAFPWLRLPHPIRLEDR